MQPSFLSGGTTPRPGDTNWTEAQRWLGALQNRACADPKNNGRRTDSYWRTLYKIAASIAGCITPVPPVTCTVPEMIADSDAARFTFAVTVNGDFIVGVGDNGQIRTSSDGATWDEQVSGTVRDLYGVAFGNSAYVAGGQAVGGFSPNIIRSTDGENWLATESLGSVGASINGIAFGEGVFVAVVGEVSGDAQIRSSADGISWPITTVVVASGLNKVVFWNGIFMILGSPDLIMTSSDGSDWMTQTTGTSGLTFGNAAYGNGVWIATSNSFDNVYRSTDNGVTWAPVAVPDSMGGIDFGNGLFVMQAASSDEIYTSTDGLTWTLTEVTGGDVSLVRYYKDCNFITTKS